MIRRRRPAVVKAAGIEPASKVLRKERWRATSVVGARFSAECVAPPSPLESPTVPPPVLETFWRRYGIVRKFQLRLEELDGVLVTAELLVGDTQSDSSVTPKWKGGG